MSKDITVFVDCMVNGKIVKTYDFLCPASLAGPPVMPPNDQFIEEAKIGLSNEGLAVPPFSGLQFVIRR